MAKKSKRKSGSTLDQKLAQARRLKQNDLIAAVLSYGKLMMTAPEEINKGDLVLIK